MANEIKAALWTAFFSFLGLFGASVLGWVQEVVTWSNAGGVEVFPDVSVLGRAAVAAFGAALIGFLNWAYRFAQTHGVNLPGAKPVYVPPPEPDAGFDFTR